MPRQPKTRKKGRGPSVGDLQKTNPSERPFISLDGFGRWNPSRGSIIRTIGCIWKRHLTGPYPSWTKVPAEGKEKYWSVFKETYNWDPEQEDKIHDAFNKEIQVSMTGTFSVLHKHLRAGGENPQWLCEEYSKGLMEYWDSEAFKKRSDASMLNRRKGEKITHRNGSSNPEAHEELNAMLVGAYPFEDPDDPKDFRKTIQVNGASTICGGSSDIYINICKKMPLSLEQGKHVDEFLLNPCLNLNDCYYIERDPFLTLQPGMWLHGGVLDNVAYVTWHERLSSIDSRHWNLPTLFCTFAQRDDLDILDLERKVFGQSGLYRGRPDECLSVSIPIYDFDSHHWLLCRIDFEKMEIAICDTLRHPSAYERREQLIRNAVKKLDQMSRVSEHRGFKVRGIDTLPYVYSTTLPQQPNTYDCGIYVCLLMMFREGVNRALSEEESASTRRRMAFKLYNDIEDTYFRELLSQGKSSNVVLPWHYQSKTHVQTDIPTTIPEPEIDAPDLETQGTVERDENVIINQTEETITPGSKRGAANLTTTQPMVNSASTIHGGSTDIYINICKEMPLFSEEGIYIDDVLLNPGVKSITCCLIERDSFLTLRPGMWLHSDVLDILAYVIWLDRSSSTDSHHWNLPTKFCTFAQRDDLDILDLERKVFGPNSLDRGPADECLSVSIPIYDLDSHHWLLCRIDFEKMEIVICDTLRHPSAYARREQLIRNAVKKLDQLSRVWERGEFKVRGRIDTLPYVYCTTLPQQPNTYDCGLYVCLLMMFREGVNRALSEEESASTRRRMAYKLYLSNRIIYTKVLRDIDCDPLLHGDSGSGVLPQHYQSETLAQTDIPIAVRDPEFDALDLETQETVELDENVTINQTEETTTPGSKRKAANMTTVQPMVKCSDQYSDKVDKMGENGHRGTHQSPKNSIGECMSILYATDGVEVCGEVWLYATTTLFLNSDYRELFSALQPHDRKVWLESMLAIDMQKRGMSTSTSTASASRGISGDNEFASA